MQTEEELHELIKLPHDHAECVACDAHIELLERENNRLRGVLKQHMEGLGRALDENSLTHILSLQVEELKKQNAALLRRTSRGSRFSLFSKWRND